MNTTRTTGRAWRALGRLIDGPGSGDRDPLTGLANRRLLYERLCRGIAESRRSGTTFALLMLDLDRFSAVNDTYGREVGDEVLVAVARRLREVVRSGDLLARVGGDEFAVVPQGILAVDDVEAIGERLGVALGAPFFLSGERHFSTTAGIGIAVGDGRSTPEGLLREADAAMYRAKALGRGRRVTFNATMRADLHERAAMQAALQLALERDEFRLHYQPVVSLADERIVGCEALLRWSNGTGRVSPADFVPLLEESGLIVPVGAWVLEEACRQVRAWDGPGTTPMTMAVNVSVRQLAEADFADVVVGVLARTGVRPAQVCLEITEAAMMEDVVSAWSCLRRLKSLGVRLAVDDFGTGYSSLSHLKHFALDVIKVDQSFVRGMTECREDAAIVRAVLTLAQALDLEAVAEGVETPEQRDALRDLGCPLAQGYYFARPAAPDAIAALLGARGGVVGRPLVG